MGKIFNSAFRVGDLVRINRRSSDPSNELFKVSEIFWNPKDNVNGQYSYKITPFGNTYYSVIYKENELVLDHIFKLNNQFKDDLKWVLIEG